MMINFIKANFDFNSLYEIENSFIVMYVIGEYFSSVRNYPRLLSGVISVEKFP